MNFRRLFSRAAATLALTVLTTATAGAWSGSGTSGDPYQIASTADLDQLATNVNSGTTYQNVYFKLTKDITYSTSGLGETESNFTPIGGANGLFKGHFDGDGNTISGIRIYRSGSTDTDKYLGLFGVIEGTEGNLAEVKRVTLKNARITGYWYCGGIVGNCNYTQITDCHVSDDVTIHAVKNNSINHGGIAGNTFAYSEISGCTSDATISMADGLTGCDKFGGIAGSNDATIKECLVLPNAKVTCTSYVGAIVGRNNGTLTSNAYTRFGVFGVGALNSQWGSDQTGAQFGKLSIGDEPSDWSSVPSSSYTGGIKVYDKGIKYGGVGYKGMYDCNYTFTTMTDCWGITSGNDGSPEHPYIITTTVGLDLLADQVNKKTNGYYQKYFELGADITYSYTYAWNSTSNDNANQNNYTPIGTQFSGGSDYSFFTGYFDGKGHTVSGIRFFTDGNGWIDGYKGLFGRTDNEVKNVTLADTRITGFLYCGGIAGQSYSNITNCHVGSDVVIRSSSNYHGGIVGEAISNYPTTISGCTSAASSSDNKYGGIVGSIDAKTTVKDCLYLGAFLTGSSEVGAIASSNEGTLTNNYHTVFGAGGVNGADNDGAKFAVGITTLPADIGAEGMTYGESTYTGITAYANGLKYDNKYYITPAIFSLADDGDNSTALSTNDGKVAIVTLDDRTIYKDGNWNTLCLPFALDAEQIAASPLASFTIKEMLNTSNLDGEGKLTLNFEDATTIEAGKPYIVKWDGDLIIKNKNDWDAFCQQVNNGETFEGKVVKLADDFDNSGNPVTTYMAGRYTSAGDTYYRFKGTFDGNGRTLTVNYDNSLTRTAPFQYVDGATIMNLTIAGSIKDSKKILGGLIGSTIGNTVISNCRVSATIQSTVVGDGTVGGFIALVDGGSTSFENCLFDGRFEGSNTYRWSGFVGWFENNNATSLSISNCLFAPSSVNIKADSNNRNFYRTRDAYTPTLDKAYYKTALATNTQGGTDTQGSDANDMDNTTLLSNLGSGWEISGGNVVPKMKMNTVADIVNPVFTGVTIVATAPTPVTSTDGKVSFVGTYSPFATTDGLLLDAHNTANGAFHAALSTPASDGNSACWYTDAGKITAATTIPFAADGSATLYVKWLKTVSYIDENGTEQTHGATEIDGTETNLPGGWYVVNSDVALTTKLNFTGDTHLILADDKTLSIDASGDSDPNYVYYGLSCRGASTSYDLTIYGQKKGTGKVTSKHGHPGYATSFAYNAKNITINGGVVEATSSGRGLCGSSVTINGGQIILAPSYANITADNITLGWRKPSDYIQAYQFINPSGVGTIQIAAGKMFTDGTNVYDSNTDQSTLGNLTNVTLRPCLVLADNASNADAIAEYNGKTIAVALNGRTLYRDGKWNTLCLPFNVTIASSPLAGDPGSNPETMTLNTSTSKLEGSTLTLSFNAATTIPAGTPFLMKWVNTAQTITNPVFVGATIDATARNIACDLGSGKSITFTGTYDPVTYADETRSVLFLGGNNTLYFPDGKATTTIGAFRAYFTLNGITAGDPSEGVRAFVLNFGEEETGIISVQGSKLTVNGSDAWYSLDGRRLSGKPTKSGVYVNNGRKVVIK